MLRRRFIATGFSATGAALLAGAAWARAARGATRGWKTLLDGRSLDGWSQIGDANWSVADGVVQADKGKSGFLVSKDSYGDVQIRAEVWVSDDANSGVFIRATNPLQVTAANAYECNIYDQRPDPSYGTGAIVDVAKVSPMPKAGGRWNVMEITAKGDRFSLVLNGMKTVDNVQDGKHAHGRIALQYAAGVVKFRKVQVREI